MIDKIKNRMRDFKEADVNIFLKTVYFIAYIVTVIIVYTLFAIVTMGAVIYLFVGLIVVSLTYIPYLMIRFRIGYRDAWQVARARSEIKKYGVDGIIKMVEDAKNDNGFNENESEDI